jgi:MATE family multidrug resistance protein
MSSAFSENRKTIALALPIAAGHVGQMLMGWADTIMLGHVGMVPLAASAFANTVLMSPFVFGFGILSAVSVRASIAHGAGNEKHAGTALRAGCWLGAIVGLAVSALMLAISPFLSVFGQPAEVNEAGATYLILCALSVAPALVSTSAKNFSEALSRPWIPFWILIGAVCLNVFLNWILIYGNLGAPAMGLEGAGLATLLARIVGAVVMVSYPLWDSRLRKAALGRWFSPRLIREMRALVSLGLPVGTMHLAEVSGFAMGSIMLGWIGVAPLAAHQIAITCAATTFMFPLGLSQAVSVRVGQARGSDQKFRCRPIAVGALTLSTLVMAGFACIFIFAGAPIAGIFTKDAQLITLTAQLLMVAGFFQIFDGLQVVSSGALRGFEDVRVPMLIGISAYWVVALPVCYLAAFTFQLGAIGVWLGFSAGLAFASFALISRLVIKLRSPGYSPR